MFPSGLWGQPVGLRAGGLSEFGLSQPLGMRLPLPTKGVTWSKKHFRFGQNLERFLPRLRDLLGAGQLHSEVRAEHGQVEQIILNTLTIIRRQFRECVRDPRTSLPGLPARTF